MRKPKFSITAAICMVLVCALIAGCVAAGPTSAQKDPPATTPTTAPTTTGGAQPTGPKPTDPIQSTTPADNDISWSMEGTLLLADGTVAGNVPLSVTGTIQDQENGTAYLVLDIVPDDSFRYSFDPIPEPNGYVSINRPHACKDYYVCHSYCYDKQGDDLMWSVFAIDPEKGYIILTWEDGTGRYLVASADPNVDAKTVFDHFAEFREKFAFSASGNTQPPEPVDEELAKFNALFGDYNSWYNKALTCEYTSPTQISLECLFYLGFQGESREPTDAEWAQLEGQHGFHINYGLIRLPVDKMNQVLVELFDITLEDMEDVAFEDVVYLESTNCYYHMVTDALFVEDFNAIAVENLDDGTIRVYYTQDDWSNEIYVVTLMPHGDGYRILSNIALNTKEPDFTEPPMDSTLSEEVRQQISDAMYAQHREPVYWKSGARYYGTYGDCVVFFVPGTWIGESYSQIGIYEFAFNPGGNLWVYKDGAIESLHNAYKQQWITDEQLAQIHTVHRNKQSPVFSTQRVDLEALKPYWQPPTQEVVKRINAIHKEKTDYPLDFDGIKGYYGTYGDLVVVFSQGNIPTDTGIQVADYYFQCAGFFHIYVFTEDAMFDLRQAYEMGLLTYEQIAMVYTNHVLSGRNEVHDE